MPPAKSMKPRQTTTRIESQSDDDGQSHTQSQSQSQDTIDIQTVEAVIRRQREQAKVRRSNRLDGIECSRKQERAKVQKKMGECEQQAAQRQQESRHPKIERLRELLEQKRRLERKLQEHHAVIDTLHEQTFQQIEVALRERLTDLDAD